MVLRSFGLIFIYFLPSNVNYDDRIKEIMNVLKYKTTNSENKMR